nr:unnamed protein product [Spirometra erinaceieuropaei]
MVAEQRRLGSPCDEEVSILQLQDLPLTNGNDTILYDVSTASRSPFVPPFLRRKVFSSMHYLPHPESRATDKLVSNLLVWPVMNKDLKAWTRACLGCQRSNIQRHNKAPINIFPTPNARFSHVDLGIASPLHGVAAPTFVKNLLSRWFVIFVAPPLSRLTAVPNSHLTSSSLFSPFRADGRAVSPPAEDLPTCRRRFKELDTPPPLVLLGICSSFMSNLNCSVAKLVIGTTVRHPGQMLPPTPRVAVETPYNFLHRLRVSHPGISERNKADHSATLTQTEMPTKAASKHTSNMLSIYVGNLTPDATETDLIEYFSEFGQVKAARVVIDSFTGQCLGYGFVTFADEDAIKNGVLDVRPFLNGRPLIVLPEPPTGDSPASTVQS